MALHLPERWYVVSSGLFSLLSKPVQTTLLSSNGWYDYLHVINFLLIIIIMRKPCLSDWVENVGMLFCGQMFAVSGRTQQEQIDALLNEISDEVEIDARAADRKHNSGNSLRWTNCCKFS